MSEEEAGVSRVQAALEAANDIAADIHLCCPRTDEDDDEDYDDIDNPGEIGLEEKKKRIRDGKNRLSQACWASLALGAPGLDEDLKQNFFRRLEGFLKSCSSCIRNWHRARKGFLQNLSEMFQEDEIPQVEQLLHKFDFNRIGLGLQEAKQFIEKHNGVADQKTFLDEDQQELLLAIFEALCCLPYLSLPQNRADFNYVFEKIQERRTLKLAELLPTMTFFLFDPDKIRYRFAANSWKRIDMVSVEDFEWAIKDTLMDAMQRVVDVNASAEESQRFWNGFLLIVNGLDRHIVDYAMRAMEMRPYETALQHLTTTSERVLGLVLRSICVLLEKSNRTFWEAFAIYSKVTVAEEIFRSPAYLPLLNQGPEAAMMIFGEKTPSGPMATSWVKLYIDSIPATQKADVCDSLVLQLLDRFGSNYSVSIEGREACQVAAAEALASTLESFASPSFKLHAGTSTFQTNNILNLALKHKDLINGMAKLKRDTKERETMSKAAHQVIEFALALDSRITAEEWSALQLGDDVQLEVRRNSAGIWDAFLEILWPGQIELAKVMLLAVGPLTSVEEYRPRKKQRLSPAKEAFNAEFRKTSEAIGRMIERLADFSTQELNQLCSEPDTIRPIVASLIHGEDAVNMAGVAFIKTVTNEQQRTEAILVLLKLHFHPALVAYIQAMDKISEKRALWSPQNPMLRCSRDILNALTDPSSGILRSKTLAPLERDAVVEWWIAQWSFINTALKNIQEWSHSIEVDTLKEFCREIMEFAEALLAQDGTLASALDPNSLNDLSTASATGPTESAMMAILQEPRKQSMGLAEMLRLKDHYLVDVTVNVLSKLLRRLAEFGLEIPQGARNFIRDAVVRDERGRYKTGTNMTRQQIAQLQSILFPDTDDSDDLQITAVKKLEAPKKQSSLEQWSRSGSTSSVSTPTTASQTSTSLSSRPRPAPAPGKDDLRSVMRGIDPSRPDKSRPKAAPPLNLKAQAIAREQMLEKRKKDQEELARARAEQIAKAKSRALLGSKPTVPGEGSGLKGLKGAQGKDHAPEKSEMMVDSSSEDESDGDDADFLKQTKTGNKRNDDEASRIRSMKSQPRGPVKKQKIQRSKKDLRARLVPPMERLHAAILEWDIFHEGNDPPNGIVCSNVDSKYGEPSEYRSTFFPLLISEAWRSFVTSKDESTNKPFGVKVINRMSVDKFIEVATAMPEQKQDKDRRERFLSEGDIVLLSQASNPLDAKEEPHCLGRISRIQFKNGALEVSYRINGNAGPIMASLVPQGELYAVKITNMTTIEREYAALESLQYYDLAYEILEGKPSPMLNFSEDAVNNVMTNYHLNPGQAKAILNAKENDAFTLVQGPPGTGKTKTIVAMVGALLTGSFNGANGTVIKKPAGGPGAPGQAPAKKLLVCAPSNAAVDELVIRLKEGVKTMTGSFHKINVLRLGRTDAINSAVKDVTLDELVNARLGLDAAQNGGVSERDQMHKEAGQIKTDLAELRPALESARATDNRELINELTRKFDELKRRQARIGAKIDADKDSGLTTARNNELRRRKVQQEILESSHVLCATLSGSGHEMFRNLEVEFETVIIDEAAQCVELSALIPLKYGCSKCILVGDPKQLPPTVLSQSAARYGYDQSLFVRMQQNHPKEVHLLDRQYRMHPEISMYPSKEFYEGRLIDGDDMIKLRRQPWHDHPLLGPYRFFDVEGTQQRGQRGQSLVNTEELKVAAQLYARFRDDNPKLDLKRKVGIITPYKAQLYALRDHFSRIYGQNITDDIEFNTTDAFQGRECEIIIFSCVRASPTGGIGFMTDIRRMNVGLTRAKSSLWILGDSRALIQGQYWAKLIEDAKARQRYTNGDILKMLRKPGMKNAAPPPSTWSTPQVTPLPSKPATPVETPVASPAVKSVDEDVDMADAPPVAPLNPNKHKTAQLPQTYTLLERQQPAFADQPIPGFSGINERGEAVVDKRSEQRPVIQNAGDKRRRDSSTSDNQPPKRKASGFLPGKPRPPPSGPRNPGPRPKDPSAMAVLGMEANNTSSGTPGGQQPPPRPPPNAPQGPSNPQQQPPRGQVPPKPKTSSDPFIRRKPNRPR